MLETSLVDPKLGTSLAIHSVVTHLAPEAQPSLDFKFKAGFLVPFSRKGGARVQTVDLKTPFE